MVYLLFVISIFIEFECVYVISIVLHHWTFRILLFISHLVFLLINYIIVVWRGIWY